MAVLGGTALFEQHPEPTDALQPTPPGSVIGDERTADPCALIDENQLRQFGSVKVVTTYGNFNRCDALIDVGAKRPVDVEVQLITRASRVVQGRPLEVVKSAHNDSECDRTVVVDDEYAVRVTAKLHNPPADLCTVATVATDTVLTVLRNGSIPRRAGPFPDDSLAHANACTLLDSTTLVTVAAVDIDSAVNVFGNWACKWFSSVGGLGINVRFDQHPAQEKVNGELVHLGGHAAYVWLDPDSNNKCTVSVPHRPPTSAPRAHIDVVVLTVEGDRPGAEYCPRAENLAAVAAQKLPS
ncbi:hypothetical protein [Actinosynnema sp. ALI-1.44]|uniref:hypothetical protein n=1 Tax=Actinosynnema sp. ALI-1.44 TaxID=1933779 RepID=UPI001177C9C8|nr:hypothetical protein [Actinosynnema sp. ALI-1.44]